MQQHSSKYFACRPPPPPTLGVGSKKFFSEHGKIKWNHECRNVVANILPADRPLGWDHLFSSEHGHAAGKHDGSNMVANSLPADPPPPSRWIKR